MPLSPAANPELTRAWKNQDRAAGAAVPDIGTRALWADGGALWRRGSAAALPSLHALAQ